MRVLDVDSECRPLSWIASDFVSKELTAIAWAWDDRPEDVTCYLLGETDAPTMLQAFRVAYQQADVVTGHFVIGHDLPLINGALMEARLPVLPDKMIHDTKLALVRRAGISASQENLSAMLRLEHNKIHMNQSDWRDANRLTVEGRARARKRVTSDVQQHLELRRELLRLGYLAPPRLWKSGVQAPEVYTP